MKQVGRATIFEIGDMIGSPNCQTEIRVVRQGTVFCAAVRAVPAPFYDGWLARMRSAWEVFCGRAYPSIWPEPGDLESALSSEKR